MFEISYLIPKDCLHFIDFANIYGNNYYLKTNAGRKIFKKLPFQVHNNLNNYLDTLDTKELRIKRKLSIEDYNNICDNFIKLFKKEVIS